MIYSQRRKIHTYKSKFRPSRQRAWFSKNVRRNQQFQNNCSIENQAEIRSPLTKEGSLAYCYKCFRENSTIQVRLYFSFEQNNNCVFSIRKIEIHRDQLIPAKISNINYHKIHSFYENRYLIGYKRGVRESNYDILRTHNKRRKWWCVLFHQKLRLERNACFWTLL